MTTLITVNGNPFPEYKGEALSWSIGLYHTHAEQEIGFPRAKAVIAAMREHRPEQLERERYEALRGSFNRIFGHSAKQLLDLIEQTA